MSDITLYDAAIEGVAIAIYESTMRTVDPAACPWHHADPLVRSAFRGHARWTINEAGAQRVEYAQLAQNRKD